MSTRFRHSRRALAVAALLAASQAPGQRVQDGWLSEVLDLDIGRAREQYRAAEQDPSTPEELRTLARARQLDLVEDPWGDEATRLREALRRDPIVILLGSDPDARMVWRRGRRPDRGDERAPDSRNGDAGPPEPDIRPSLFAALIPEVEPRLGTGRDREIRQLLDQIVETYRKPDGAAERERLRQRLAQLAPERARVDRRQCALTLMRYRLAGREDLAERFAQQFPGALRTFARNRPAAERLRWALAALPDLIAAVPPAEAETLQSLDARLREHEGEAAAESLVPLLDALSAYANASGFGRRGGRRPR